MYKLLLNLLPLSNLYTHQNKYLVPYFAITILYPKNPTGTVWLHLRTKH
jgi:hypothetical protein